MSDEWIKMRLDLGSDPAVIAISLALTIPRAEVVGHLHAVWSWADKHCKEGRARGITFSYIDELSRPGFADAMATLDPPWLASEPGGVLFPNFDAHNGESAKKRADESKRQRRSRKSRAADNDAGHKNVTEMSRPAVTNPVPPLLLSKDLVVDLEGQNLKTIDGGVDKKPRRAAAHAMPADFDLTGERRAYAVKTLGEQVDTDSLFEQWRAHHLSKDSRFVDWDKAWQTWVLNGLKYDFPKKAQDGPIGRLGRNGGATAAAGARWIGSAPPAPPGPALTLEREPGED